jgi:hypothetical protein
MFLFCSSFLGRIAGAPDEFCDDSNSKMPWSLQRPRISHEYPDPHFTLILAADTGDTAGMRPLHTGNAAIGLCCGAATSYVQVNAGEQNSFTGRADRKPYQVTFC